MSRAWLDPKDGIAESPSATKATNSHFLDQLCDAGFFKHAPKYTRGLTKSEFDPPPRQPLYATVAINALTSILDDGLFSFKYRLFLMWWIDAEALGLEDLAAKALAKGHWHYASAAEMEEITQKTLMPNVTIFNQISAEPYDVQSIRVYGGERGKTALLWNQGWHVTCKEDFELNDFPFDQQTLNIEFRQNDPKTWEAFDLRVHLVQFHKISLQMPQWQMLEPTVTRVMPEERCTNVELHVRRYARYYVQNVVCALFLLSSLGLVIFSMEVSDLGSRVSTALTLILSSIAFKFILSSTLPSVPYNTCIDYYVLASTLSLCVMTWFSIIPQTVALAKDPDAGDQANHILMIISAIMVGVFFFAWLAYAVFVRCGGVRFKKIRFIKKANWYAFNYGVPSFLKDPEIRGREWCSGLPF